MDYKVKGSSLLSKVAFVEEHFGQSAKDAINTLSQDNNELFPILTSAWYRFDLFAKVLEAIAQSSVIEPDGARFIIKW